MGDYPLNTICNITTKDMYLLNNAKPTILHNIDHSVSFWMVPIHNIFYCGLEPGAGCRELKCATNKRWIIRI